MSDNDTGAAKESLPVVYLDDAYHAAGDAAFAASPIYVGGHVTFRLDGLAPATQPGVVLYSEHGADGASFSLPVVRGTVLEDGRDLNPHTGELEGPLLVRVDQTVTWQGDRTGPRDFTRGALVRIWAKDVEPDELQTIGRRWAAAQVAAANIVTPVREELRAAILKARNSGLSETEIAVRVRTTRQTVRDIQGKPRSARKRPTGTAKALDLLNAAGDDWAELASASWVDKAATAASPEGEIVTKLGIRLRRSADGSWNSAASAS